MSWWSMLESVHCIVFFETWALNATSCVHMLFRNYFTSISQHIPTSHPTLEYFYFILLNKYVIQESKLLKRFEFLFTSIFQFKSYIFIWILFFFFKFYLKKFIFKNKVKFYGSINYWHETYLSCLDWTTSTRYQQIRINVWQTRSGKYRPRQRLKHSIEATNNFKI